MGKQELIRELEAARADFLDAIEGLSDDAMLRPGAAGIWSVKDIMAHLVAWQSELVTALNDAQTQPKKTPRIIDIEEDIQSWNQEQYHKYANRRLDVIKADFAGVHEMLLRMVREYNGKALTDRRRYAWMMGEPLSYLIEEVAALHEREHAEDIRAWRQGEGL